MKKILILLLICNYVCISLNAQYLNTYQLYEQFTLQEAVDYLNNEGVPAALIPMSNGLKSYKITYNTVGWDSLPTQASGVVFVPAGVTCHSPLMVYNHGTILKKNQAPSMGGGEYVIGVAMAADAMVVAMPDYLGLGTSPGIHPYHHAHSEATCVIDMIRATRELMQVLSYELNGQVFLTGYSQGGHVTMAAHKLIESHFSNEFDIAASAPLSGAYQLSGVQAEVISQDSSYGAPGYLPFIINTFNTVYQLYPSYSDIYKPPYDVIVPGYFNGNFSIGQLESVIPDTPNVILLPSVLADFNNNPSNVFRQALEDNDVYDWTPVSPTRMYYCEADHLVTYLNSIEAKNAMHANGATQVEAISANLSANHQDCALFALLNTKFYFETFRTDRFQSEINVTNASSQNMNDAVLTALPLGGFGPYTFQWNGGQTDSVLSQQTPGNYTVLITDANGCTSEAFASVGVMFTNNYKLSDEIHVFPNPTNGLFYIEFTIPPSFQGLCVLTTLSGEIVKYQVLETDADIVPVDVSSLAKGSYLLSVYKNGIRRGMKILVQ
jgi:hypothetical protein